jgi:hypothetical protein
VLAVLTAFESWCLVSEQLDVLRLGA